MRPNQAAEWLGSLLPPEPMLIDAPPAPFPALAAEGIAATCGFSEVDTGLALESETGTDVRCEMVVHAGVDKQLLGAALGAAATMLLELGVPAQPGVLLEHLLDRVDLPEGVSVRHGWLREPRLFEQGTPLVREPGRLTLLLELVLLTDDEFAIASEQGGAVLERRMRRRGAAMADWHRDA
ncbi:MULTISPECIES: hypothetical protein [Corynebacterium]|nr:hypothetical protein [Corynebacterium hadale]